MKKYILSSLLVMLLPFALCGQALRGSYFMDSSIQRVKLNPSFAPKTNYFTIPVVGDLSINVDSNLGAQNFLFPKNGVLYTYLNQNVTSAEFKSLLPELPHIQFDFNTDLLGTGFYLGKRSFLTIDVGLKTDVKMNIPSQFFIFFKDGMTSPEQVYNFKDFAISENVYAQLSVGYRRDMSDLVPGLSVGMKVKALAGVSKMDVRINDAEIFMSSDKLEVKAEAEGTMYGKFVEYVEPVNDGENGKFKINPSELAPSGWGVAVDLGAEYKLKFDNPIVNGVNFSASVVDLGAIFYSEDAVTTLTSGGHSSFKGFQGISTDFDFSHALKNITQDFLSLADLQKVQGGKSGTASLINKAFAGVEVPFINNLMSVGLLYSYMYGFSDLTASYNLKVANIFNVGVNYSFLNTTKSFGCILEFVPRNGVAIFLGSDYVSFNYTPQGIPVDKALINAKLGIQATFGSKYLKKN